MNRPLLGQYILLLSIAYFRLFLVYRGYWREMPPKRRPNNTSKIEKSKTVDEPVKEKQTKNKATSGGTVLVFSYILALIGVLIAAGAAFYNAQNIKPTTYPASKSTNPVNTKTSEDIQPFRKGALTTPEKVNIVTKLIFIYR
jgi:hypothetical protein